MPFGRMEGMSVEQICVRDYKYFTYILDNIEIRKRSLAERFDFVEFVVNHFKSQAPCGNTGCEEVPRYISIYHNARMNVRDSSLGFIYCSEDCFQRDGNASHENTSLQPLRFRTAVSSTKTDTNRLVNVIGRAMGLKQGRLSQEYLEKFFDEVTCW